MTEDWPFADPENVAVITTRSVIEDGAWIAYVTHDASDGGWQFHPPGDPVPAEDARVVGLANIVRREPRLRELADLPLGWHAWRESPEAAWQRAARDGA